MARLLLVKHARPDIDPSVPAPAWRLSDAGREGCARLATALRPFAPSALLASPQLKAHETARIVGDALGLDVEVRDDLREQDDAGTPFFGSEEEFAQAVRIFFERPAERVFGRETADEALARFEAAVDVAIREHQGRTIALSRTGGSSRSTLRAGCAPTRSPCGGSSRCRRS